MKIIYLLLMSLILTTITSAQYSHQFSGGLRRFGISVKAGPAFPNGAFADLFGTGYTGFVEVPYYIAKNFSVYAGVGLSHFTADNDKLSNALKAEGQTLTTNIDAPYWVLPLVLGINVSYHYAHIWPYFTFSGGVYFQKLETSGSYTSNGVVTTVAPTTQNWTQGAYAVGLGTYIPIGDEGWAFDVNAKFNSVVDSEGKVIVTPPSGEDVTTRAIQFVSILGGVSYTFK
jgi:hypothetical protein